MDVHRLDWLHYVTLESEHIHLKISQRKTGYKPGFSLSHPETPTPSRGPMTPAEAKHLEAKGRTMRRGL